ncbi:GNAT family N-acetyltransferase [Streptomyces sp. NBC_00690]|uniref:GNAT family N-acetyltransferase n=1 Tax=Streptomyces sp. NBC_00690 TaxID=2975808 RepID=UPI002E2CC835|nr:GNAT family N-acetyltransferase [Streptomyces sp. NBC_00690]
MTDFPLTLRRFGLQDVDTVRDTLVDTYAEVYADRLAEPFLSLHRFQERLQGHISRPGWTAVVGYDGDQAIGYAYAAPLPESPRWWVGLTDPATGLDTTETGSRTLALFELMVRTPWRKTGTAQAIHEDLLTGRPEERVTLMVEPHKPGVRRLYERWGYARVGSVQPFPDSPTYHVMLRELGGDQGAGSRSLI